MDFWSAAKVYFDYSAKKSPKPRIAYYFRSDLCYQSRVGCSSVIDLKLKGHGCFLNSIVFIHKLRNLSLLGFAYGPNPESSCESHALKKISPKIKLTLDVSSCHRCCKRVITGSQILYVWLGHRVLPITPQQPTLESIATCLEVAFVHFTNILMVVIALEIKNTCSRLACISEHRCYSFFIISVAIGR